MKKALITGISGQDGSYLAEFLLSKGYEVHGTARYNSLHNTSRVSHLGDRVKLHQADMTDLPRLQEIVHKVRPDEVYNLGAQSHVHHSFEQPVYTAQVNAMAPLAILEALRDGLKDTRFYEAATSEMFGATTELMQNEKTPFRPRSPYACAKIFAYHQTLNYRDAYGLFACSGILFNHESPRRGEMFVTRKITRGAARIKVGLQHELRLGNLEAKRDWGFAGDYIKAMWMMLQQDTPDDYVIATGEMHSVAEFVRIVFDYFELDWTKYVVEDEAFKRPADVHYLCGDSSKAMKQLGWTPKVDFRELVEMMAQSDLEAALAEQQGKAPVTKPHYLRVLPSASLIE
jgi:GDPmannose 4,6-dehydratase